MPPAGEGRIWRSCPERRGSVLQLTPAQARKAVTSLMRSDRVSALELARKFERAHPHSRDLRELLGWVLTRLHDDEAAVAQYARAAELGTSASIEEGLGYSMRRLGRYADSARHYLRAMALTGATLQTRAVAANAIHVAGDHAFARQVSYPGLHVPPMAALDFARWVIEFDRPDQRLPLRERLLCNESYADQAIYFWQSRDVEPLAQIDRKDRLAELIESVTAAEGPAWWPRTFRLPEQESEARAAMRSDPKAAWIVKEPHLAGTQGVRLFRGTGDEPWPEGGVILQRFVEPPFLYEGRKINIRMHVSLLAPRIDAASLWSDGLVFVSTSDYADRTRPALFVNPLSADKEALQKGVGSLAAPGVALQAFLAVAFDTATAKRVRDRLVETTAQFVRCLETGGVLAAMRATPDWRGLPPTFFGLDLGLDADLCPWLFEAEVDPGHGLGSPTSREVWRRFRRDWMALALEAPDAPRASFLALA